MTTYKVFVRNWWRYDGPNRLLVPDPGARKTVLRTRLSEDEARQMCRDYNATHRAGPLSRKAEYTKE